jgi:hypothetical protein
MKQHKPEQVVAKLRDAAAMSCAAAKLPAVVFTESNPVCARSRFGYWGIRWRSLRRCIHETDVGRVSPSLSRLKGLPGARSGEEGDRRVWPALEIPIQSAGTSMSPETGDFR